MKTKILFISLAVVLALSVGLVGCGPTGDAEPESIVIGTARDTDQPALSIFEWMAAGPVMRAFVKDVNDGGGVHLKEWDTTDPAYTCMVDLEIDRREMNVPGAPPGDVADVTREIIDDIKAGTVHYLWGGPGTDCIYAQAPIANAEEVVLFTFEGGATNIHRDPTKLADWPYVFVNLSYSDWYQLPVLAAMLEDKLGVGEGEVPAYVNHIEGEHGDEYLLVANECFNVTGSAELPAVAEDMDPDAIMDAAIAALGSPGYQLYLCAAYPDHVLALTGVAMEKDFDPPAMIFGPGANFGFYAYAFPDELAPDPTLVDGILCYAVASYNKTSEGITAAYDKVAAQINADGVMAPLPGIFALDYWGIPLYWAACEMWLAAVEDVGDVGYDKQTALRNSLAASSMETILGTTYYQMFGDPGQGGGNMEYTCHTGEIGQWKNDYLEIVGPVDAGEDVPGLPNYVVTGNFTFPMTGLWNWL